MNISVTKLLFYMICYYKVVNVLFAGKANVLITLMQRYHIHDQNITTSERYE